ncbi:hypothetical protein Tco_0617176 [Tanacetum coccineum]
MESLNSNSKERELQLMQRLIKQRYSHCMAWFEQLETHLGDLYLNSSSHAVDAFKLAFHSFFGEEHQTFRYEMFYNLDQLRLQLERKRIFLRFIPRLVLTHSEHYSRHFLPQKGRDLLENLDTLEVLIHRAVITYGRLQLQLQDVQINPVQAVDDRLSVSKSSWIESENNNALRKLVNETLLQLHESLVTESTTLEANLSMDINALDVRLAVTESNGTNSYKQDTSSSSGNHITHVADADIRPVKDKEPMAEVQLTAAQNVLANEQQHTDQSKPSYDTYLLEKVNSNTTPDSTNMCHRGGEIDQDAEQYNVKSPLLNAELVKSKVLMKKKTLSENADLKGSDSEDFIKCWSKGGFYWKDVPIAQQSGMNPQWFNEDIINPDDCEENLMSVQTTLQAPFLKEKKGVRFSALYLQKKRNLLVFDHSHQHPSNFPMLVQSLSGSTYISLYFNSLDQSKMVITYAIFEGENRLVQNSVSPTTYVPPSKRDYEIPFQPLFDEYLNPPPCVISPDR